MESENRHEFDVTMGTFKHPRYEIIPTGEIHDGAEAVDRYFKETRAAFPDQRNELIAMHHADEAVLRGIPATHKPFECRCLAIFEFEDEGLVCERVYFDTATILGQLGLLP